MSNQLNEDIATVQYDNLFYSDDVKAITGGVTITKGQGTLKRGTILAKAASGKMVILGTTITTGSGENQKTETPPADCVLCDDIVVADAEDAPAVAYLSGHFNIDALKVKANYSITDADKDELRTKNILVGKVLG